MAKATDYFLHIPEYKVAICRNCCYAVWFDRTPNHLKEIHSGLTTKERLSIFEDLGNWLRVYISNFLRESAVAELATDRRPNLVLVGLFI
jgi:hypothetical protein